VRWGDTLNSIAWRTGVSAWAIAQANGIYNLNRIYAGQALWIPCP
jgi:LysM repeat protein